MKKKVRIVRAPRVKPFDVDKFVDAVISLASDLDKKHERSNNTDKTKQ